MLQMLNELRSKLREARVIYANHASKGRQWRSVPTLDPKPNDLDINRG